MIIAYGPDDSGAGGVDEGAKKTLLERNLPAGQTWINSDAAKEFFLKHKESSAKPEEIEQAEFQTADGSVWALYNPKEKALVVGTPKGFKKMASLAETGSSGGF